MVVSNRWLVALMAVLTVVFAGSGWMLEGLDPDRFPREAVLIAANTAPLLLLRRNPLVAVLALATAYPIWVAWGHPIHELQSLPSIVAMYALGAWERPLWLRAVGLAAPVWMVVGGVLLLGGEALELTYVAIFFVVVWVFGVLITDRRAHALALERRTAELEQARQELADRAVADERARIARELHDVIAHAMSVITVHAGVGAHVVEQRPTQAAEALRVIERTGRQALEELRRMLMVLRDPDPDGPVPEPQPGLQDLPALIDQARQGGIQVTMASRGVARYLSPGLELSAYRLVQEALTNVVKHAPGSQARVTVTSHPDLLEVEVVNALPLRAEVGAEASHGSSARAGQGLRGMAERVSLYAGHLETVADAGQFRVTARFPIDAAAP